MAAVNEFNREYYDGAVSGYVKRLETEKGEKPKICVVTFGCQQNEADSERIIGYAVKLGYEKTTDTEEADLIIFNTCAVREHAELKALSKTGQLKKLKEKNKNLIIGLYGCMVSQQSRIEDIKHKYPYVDFAAGTNMIYKLSEILYGAFDGGKRKFYCDNENTEIYEDIPVLRNNGVKAYVSVMYGCNNFCTYCIVPYVRGRERSRKKEDILSEVRELVGEGYKEITLLGQNVNSYGKGLEEDTDFADLVEEICKIDGDFTLRFMTSHPKDVSDKLIKVIAQNSKVERHFHLPVQSGSDRILREMNRKYTKQSYLETVEKLKEAVPDIVFTTDIIVGFPGETEEDFLETLDIVKKVKYDSVFSFIYSPRPGTPACKMDDVTTAEEKTDRMTRLLSLHRDNITEINREYIGKTVTVLCEDDKDEKGCYGGKTSSFKLVKFTCDKTINVGEYVDVEIESSGESLLRGKAL